ncbi:SdpI family protein [Wukongibacter sp. M2B1]|uniref:SdpI family protein n=1 Tax=Wukongibacter sp. M2B1 TaxID=3088895 RepID=UPI003D78D651
MKISKILIVLIILSIIGTVLVYSSLPEKVPTHFNFKGEVDKYSDRSSVFFTGILPLIIYVLMIVVPKIDPKKRSYQKHEKAYSITKTTIILFCIMMHWLMIMYSLGFNVNVGMIVRMAIGTLFIVMGNFMGQIRQNYSFGIKTPWTLADKTVWKKTHRVGGFSFIVGGIILIASSFFNGIIGMIALIVAIAISAFYPMLYSYIVYRKIVD